FLFFLGSGFAGLVYEIVWLRLTMASFGVTTPLVSIALSIFMGGLAIGTVAAGRLTRRLAGCARRWLIGYATPEAAIAVLASGVPWGPGAGRGVLRESSAVMLGDSAGYYVLSAAWIALTLLPACIVMGATFPIAMAALRAGDAGQTRSFSFLYLANVIGA